MSDSLLEKKVTEYAALAKEDKNIDVATLMLNALQTEQSNMLKQSTKRWGYLVSLGAPPFGLVFAVWFFFSGKDDGKSAAWVCIALTVVSIGVFVIFLKVFTSTSGVSVQQIETIKPSDIRELTQ